ncbi:MAG: hypothetical protein HY395_01830 [Candidatus Doudnabacteria bacterium]|nr:hypothetical protein [Candidatus Doudnabacteria bacterium]
MKKILLLFTRDFDQWTQELIREFLVVRAAKIWGITFSDQIVHFNGRSFEWYRYKHDLKRVKNFMVRKKLSDPIFSPQTQRMYLDKVAYLRQLIEVNPAKIKNGAQYFRQTKELFVQIYPYYPVPGFVGGLWREDFLKVHGKRGERILNLLYKSRRKTEGVVKEVGNFLRKWLGDRVKLLTVKEVEDLVASRRWPKRNVLLARSKGYVYMNGKIHLTHDFQKLLKQKGLVIGNAESGPDQAAFKGTVAYPGRIVQSKVQTIFNSSEVSKFKQGSVLVTPMTSPEYLLAMKKAKVIVTDEGGITCHAAIVSRELKIPCIIGTKVATKVLKDGDLVEVDASKGTVRKL